MERESLRAEEHETLARLCVEHRRLARRVTALESRTRTAAGPIAWRTARALADTLSGAFAAHLALEEAEIYPSLAGRFPELGGTLERLRSDHDELRALASDLTGLVAQPPGRERDERLGVVLSDLAELLRLHFHAEEHAAFRWADHARARPRPRPRRGARRRPRTD